MLDGKMCCGIVKDDLMLRVLDEKYESVLEMPHAREMDFTKRQMKGFVYVDEAGWETDAQLGRWLDLRSAILTQRFPGCGVSECRSNEKR